MDLKKEKNTKSVQTIVDRAFVFSSSLKLIFFQNRQRGQ